MVGVVMGSKSDYGVMAAAVEMLREFGVAYEVRSGERASHSRFACLSMPRRLSRGGCGRLSPGAGGAAHLPGMLAAKTPGSGAGCSGAGYGAARDGCTAVDCADAQGCSGGYVWPLGVPGRRNAGLFAVEMLAVSDAGLRDRLAAWRSARG